VPVDGDLVGAGLTRPGERRQRGAAEAGVVGQLGVDGRAGERLDDVAEGAAVPGLLHRAQVPGRGHRDHVRHLVELVQHAPHVKPGQRRGKAEIEHHLPLAVTQLADRFGAM
jgi:hypothetical protein